MNTKFTTVVLFLILIAAFTIGLFYYPQLPDKVASHWNAQGEVDGYMSKFWGVFLMPIVMVAVIVLFSVIPKIDPLRANIQDFRTYFNLLIVAISVFLLYIFCLTIAWNLGQRFDFAVVLVPAFALLWYIVGVVVSKAKRNWFIGIRTPWTLSSDPVWEKTHRLGSSLFKVSAVVALLGLVWTGLAIWFVILPAIFVALFTLIYSYVEYHRLT